MSRKQHSSELLLAEYTLGVLDPDQLAQAHALLGSDDSAVACALHWEERFLDLSDALTPLHASDQLLSRIQASLGLPAQATGRDTEPTKAVIPARRSQASDLSGPRSAAAGSLPTRVASKRSAPASVPESIATTPPRTERHGGHLPSGALGAATLDFEPRLLRPDAASTSAAPFVPSRVKPQDQPVEPSPSPAVSDASDGAQDPVTRAEPALPPASRYAAEQSSALNTAANHAEQPARGRRAPPDPLDAFRPDPSRRRQKKSLWRNLWFWRALSGALAILAAALFLPEDVFHREPAQTASLQPAAAPAPQIVQVAIMQAPGTSSTPGWVLTVDSRQNVMLAPQVDIVVPETESVYLWTYNEQSPHPRLLGLVDPTQALTLPMEVTGAVTPGQIFEMTQESTLAAPREPQGPILFIGRTVSLG